MAPWRYPAPMQWQSDTLEDFIDRHARLFVLTGAGCSTDSGIPDYRDADGGWKRRPPVTLSDFLADVATRRRYWARSLLGWSRFGRASPNRTHAALAALESFGRVEVLLTQNVDRLHQAAGSRHVIDLHGRMDVVRCMRCEARTPREALQLELLQRNPDWAGIAATPAPDGDADLEHADYSSFDIPDCGSCRGLLKPDVVFFGENVPRDRVESAFAHLLRADAMLIVGSSLMVYSGYRFVRTAAQRGMPIAAVNLGRTRADDLLSLKVAQGSGDALAFLLERARRRLALGGAGRA